MSETMAKPRPTYQPSHATLAEPSAAQPGNARLAYLLAQLAELDIDGEKKARLEAVPEKKPDARPRLEAVPIRRPAPAAVAALAPAPVAVETVPVSPLPVSTLPVSTIPVSTIPVSTIPVAPVAAASVASVHSPTAKALKAAYAPARKPVKKLPAQSASPKAAVPKADAPKPAAKKRKAEAAAVKKSSAGMAAKGKAKPAARQATRQAAGQAAGSAVRPGPAKTTFHTALRSAAKQQPGVNPKKLFAESAFRPWSGFGQAGVGFSLTQRGLLGSLARGWAWLNSKYKTTAGKRLRLSEVVSLGDKRFVALVKVEGREFLIGGAASGLSLLASLEGAEGAAKARHPAMAAGRNPS